MKDMVGHEAGLLTQSYRFVAITVSVLFALSGCVANKSNSPGVAEEEYSQVKLRISELERKIDTQNARQNLLVTAIRDSVTTWLKVGGSKGDKSASQIEYTLERSEEIYFRVNDFTLSETDQFILDDFAMMLAENPTSLLQVIGHTDRSGHSFYNHQLSEQRANAVRRFLVKKYDIPLHRMSTLGFGEEIQKYTRDTSVSRNKNRRVEIHLLVPKN